MNSPGDLNAIALFILFTKQYSVKLNSDSNSRNNPKSTFADLQQRNLKKQVFNINVSQDASV